MPKSEGPTRSYNSDQEKSKIRAFLQRLVKFRRKENNHHKSKSTSSKIELNMRNFAEKTVEDVMIPRSDIRSVSVESKFEEICHAVVEHGHTRTLVYKGSLDNIVGFIHIKDLFHPVVDGKKTAIKKLLRKHIVSPHSMKLIDLLKQMQIARTHISIVVDEYGGTDGLVTIEDIIEEIVGRIDDEHDIDTGNGYKIIRPGVIVTSARVEMEELEEVIGIKFENDCEEIDTIGGLIMTIKGCVPEKGEVVVLSNDLVIEVIESTPRTIKQLKITYPT